MHMTAQRCGRRRVRDEKLRASGGSDAEQGERRGAVNIGSCMQWQAEESGRQTGSRRQ